MAEIVNLRLARKRKSREEKQKAADENRTKHGISKKQHRHAEAVTRLDNKRLDSAKLQRD